MHQTYSLQSYITKHNNTTTAGYNNSNKTSSGLNYTFPKPTHTYSNIQIFTMIVSLHFNSSRNNLTPSKQESNMRSNSANNTHLSHLKHNTTSNLSNNKHNSQESKLLMTTAKTQRQQFILATHAVKALLPLRASAVINFTNINELRSQDFMPTKHTAHGA